MLNSIMRYLALSLCLFGFASTTLFAQSNAFRSNQVHLSVAPAFHWYKGPLNLTNENSTDLSKRTYAGTVSISFPIKVNKLYFRGQLGAANFNPDRTGIAPNTNEFAYHPNAWFETQLVLPLSKTNPFMPYVFAGIGGLLADPLGKDNDDNNILDEESKPLRSVFTAPSLGLGVDYAVNKKFSIFAEYAHRIHWNFLAKSPNNPFNTALASAGIRLGLGGGRKTEAEDVPTNVTPAQEIPVYQPPVYVAPTQPELPPVITPEPPVYPTMPQPTPQTGCNLYELNSIYFDYNASTLDARAMSLLDENIAELRNNPACCIKVTGYTDEASSAAAATRIADARARAVADYYISHGIAANQVQSMGMGIAQPNCNKQDPGAGCRFNRRVESKPSTCGM